MVWFGIFLVGVHGVTHGFCLEKDFGTCLLKKMLKPPLGSH